ncbi:MAG: orotidine-5'-phosphate decarboxylase [Candidatus Diapherotrites archaeon]|nr:orotidine-5'-phosphate decarboxylase [Candidatus Diapherotrites archaeon]
MRNFADILLAAIDKKQNPSVVGLDPRLDRIPDSIKEGKTPGEAILDFNKGIIDAISHVVPMVKPQIAFYEQYGADGIRAFIETIEYARSKKLLVLEDVKRNDIGSTAKAYAEAHLGGAFGGDAVTVNAYLGSDGVKPFLEKTSEGKGLFILVKTSNPSSGELQDKLLDDGRAVYELMAELVDKWGNDCIGERGYSAVGAVVGATYPKEAELLRKVMPRAIFLVPGYGAQGGGADDVVPCFNPDGYGAVVNSSRGVIFAYEKLGGEFDEAAGRAAEAMREDISKALKKADKWPW